MKMPLYKKVVSVDRTTFETWLVGIGALTEPQRRQAWQALALSEAADEPMAASLSPQAQPRSEISTASLAELGQRRIDSVGCPHCDNRDVVSWGQVSALPRYRCKACLRTFNALTKTPLAKLRMKDKGATQTTAMINGVSTAKAARQCEVHYSTAFRWRHRFLAALAGDKPKALSGLVEGDQTFILESFKGKRSGLPQKSRKRGGKSAKCAERVNDFGFLPTFDDQAASRNLRPSRSRLARPYIWRLIVLSRLTCPSVWPLLHASVTAARTAA